MKSALALVKKPLEDFMQLPNDEHEDIMLE